MNVHVKRLMIMLGMLFLVTGEYATAQHCFRGKPCPQCRWFWITDSNFMYRLWSSGDGREGDISSTRRLLFSFDLGVMHNRSERGALGASISAGYEQGCEQGQIGVRLQFRRWMRRPFSFEYAPGIVVNTGKGQHKGFSNLLAISAADLVALSMRIDFMKYSRESGYQVCTYGGITLGSYAGIAGAVGVSAVIVGVALAFANSGW